MPSVLLPQTPQQRAIPPRARPSTRCFCCGFPRHTDQGPSMPHRMYLQRTTSGPVTEPIAGVSSPPPRCPRSRAFPSRVAAAATRSRLRNVRLAMMVQDAHLRPVRGGRPAAAVKLRDGVGVPRPRQVVAPGTPATRPRTRRRRRTRPPTASEPSRRSARTRPPRTPGRRAR